MKRLTHSLPFTFLFGAAAALSVACTGEIHDADGTGPAPGPVEPPGFPEGGGPGAGGGPGPGGAPGGGGGPGGCETPLPPRAYLCAGDSYEFQAVDGVYASLTAMNAAYACSGFDPYVYDDYYEDDYYMPYGGGGAPGITPEDEPGGFAGEGGFSMGGAAGGGADTGGYGAGGDGTGGWGAGGTGGGPNHPGDIEDWCADAEYGQAIAGLSYAVGSCQETELRTPITFREPFGWYEMRVYAGASPCERGEVLAETAGYGAGQIIQLPIGSVEGFVSIELTSDAYSWADAEIALQPLEPRFSGEGQ